jgi:type VI secretion system protein
LRSPILSPSRFSPARTAYLVCGAVLLLGGCAATKSLLQPSIALKDVTFEVSAKANDATPFSVDLVAVSDETLVPALLAMSAAQWFDPATNIKRDAQTTLRSWNYELTPGLNMPVKDAQFGGRGTRAVFLFANYKGKGAYRLRLDATPHATVRFADKTVELAAKP